MVQTNVILGLQVCSKPCTSKASVWQAKAHTGGQSKDLCSSSPLMGQEAFTPHFQAWNQEAQNP